MVVFLESTDKQFILNLALQVEHLFGKMVGVNEFEGAVDECLKNKCVIGYKKNDEVWGAVIIEKLNNEIAWLVVDKEKRSHGVGSEILTKAVEELDSNRDISVQTFAPSIAEGDSARRLYKRFGFVDEKNGGLNPAGIPTVIMVKRKTI